MKIAVVFVSYLKVPEERLQDHFIWNHDIYQSFGDRICVYVVSDIGHDLPSYAQCVIYPMDRLPVVAGQVRFSICMTKNAGNAKAIADGADVVICTDVDIVFSLDVFTRMADVEPSEAVVPLYRMAADINGGGSHIEPGCTGTVAMTAGNWRRIQYEEQCIGYGCDDGILLRDMERAGLDIIRDGVVTHVAHEPGDGQRTPGRGSDTCWGRASGFNPDNAIQNRRLHKKGRRR